MALFTEHPFRHVIKAILALAMCHLIMKMMPHSIQVIHLTQTSVTVLAIGALIFLVIKHNRSGGDRVLSQNQEELILIAAVGAFWLAFLLAMKSFNQSSVDIDLAHPSHLFSASSGTAESNVIGAGARRAPVAYNAPPAGGASERNAAAYGRPKTGYRKEHPCSPYDEYCVTEEWAFY
ncbi:hypothetical protein BS17DRAFT_756716 [Gyrodon lividus]|nr:hypothetical protein BS17DRAFT_756716 [Gyrodon lividus]